MTDIERLEQLLRRDEQLGRDLEAIRRREEPYIRQIRAEALLRELEQEYPELCNDK